MSDEDPDSLFNIAVATIFAREFLEASLIIGNYRTAILRCEESDEEEKKEKLKNVTIAAAFATLVATLVILAVAIPLGVVSGELDDRVVEIIEGVSKVVAAICILQLSVKIPVWLGVYAKVPLLPCRKNLCMWANGSFQEKTTEKDVGITLQEIRFNVAWNIWHSKQGLARILHGGIMLFLSVGLFVGGLHEFEEVAGETPDVYVIEDPALSSSQLPMAVLKPFGYSSSRTVLQICSFWLWLAFGVLLHFLKWRNTKIARANADTIFQAGDAVDEEKAVNYTKEDTSSDEDAGKEEGEAHA
ncbi:hypothetical protein MHU86_23075 [Fragilaria crotonensis]|nr:hypothetical protein MHU86_23075 [Fragilaria crotonensis]